MDARTISDVIMTDAQTGNDPIQVDVASPVQAAQPFPIFALPADARKSCIYSLLSNNEQGLFASTCRKAESEILFPKLWRAAVDALPSPYTLPNAIAAQGITQPVDETGLVALDILKRHPELLFKRAIVFDHFNRKIEASIYGLFLGAGDVWGLAQVHDLIIPKIPDGVTLAAAEFTAQFPNCHAWSPKPEKPGEMLPEEYLYDDRNKAQLTAVKVQLAVVVAKVTADTCTYGEATLDETKQAVESLRQLFTPKAGEVIQTGLHFPLGIMQEIFEVYSAQSPLWNGNQLTYFSRTVIGLAEAASTAVDGQCYKYGLRYLDFGKGPDRRDGLFCSHPKYIPTERAPLAGSLGNTAFCELSNGDSCFQSSNPADFDWYSKNGRWLGHGGVSSAFFALVQVRDLRRTKTEAIRRIGVYAATHRAVNTLSP